MGSAAMQAAPLFVMANAVQRAAVPMGNAICISRMKSASLKGEFLLTFSNLVRIHSGVLADTNPLQIL